ncbi:MAG: hypothetical protein ACOYM3_21945 [Terrimicrobiaceae bacterium]
MPATSPRGRTPAKIRFGKSREAKDQEIAVSRALTLPHDLGMDAALVAAAWQALVSLGAGHPGRPAMTAALFFAVWSIYLGDRLWDSWRKDPAAPRAERHRLAQRHCLLFGHLAAGSFLLASIFAFSALPTVTPLTGVALCFVAVLCAGYYFARAGFPEWERGRAVVVGGIFAAGTLLAVPGLTGSLLFWLILSLGALFTANVRICVWSEARLDGRILPLSLFPPLLLSIPGFAVAAMNGHWPAAIAGMMSIAGLGVLFFKRRNLDPEALAIQADALLFAPPLLMLAFWFVV